MCVQAKQIKIDDDVGMRFFHKLNLMNHYITTTEIIVTDSISTVGLNKVVGDDFHKRFVLQTSDENHFHQRFSQWLNQQFVELGQDTEPC